MKRNSIVSVVLFMLLLTMQTVVCAETLAVGYATWLPWQEPIGKDDAKGIGVDIFNEAVERAGHQVEVNNMPFKRRVALWGKEVHVEVGVIPEWREDFKEVSVYTQPFISTYNVVLAKKGTFQNVASIDAFRGKRIGTTLGYFYTDGFSEAFEAGTITRDDSQEGPTIMRKLMGGRVDGAIMDHYEALYWMKQMNLDPDDYEEVYVFNTSSDLRIRLHTEKAHLIEPLNAALEAMKHDGTIQQIIDTYTK